MEKKVLFQYSVVFSAVYFFSINGLAALPNLSISFLLKETLHLAPAQMAYFQAVTLLAWVVKPLWGIISDTVPLFGTRRQSYLIVTSCIAFFVWVVLAFAKSYTVGFLLGLITVSYLAYAFQDVVSDGLMIEVGKPANLTGRFQSIQWASVYLAMVLTALSGGFVSDLARRGVIAYQAIFAATAVFPFLTALIAAAFVIEPSRTHLEAQARMDLRAIFKSRALWLLALFLFLWNFSPSFGAPFFYYSVDTLKFNGSFIGILQAVTSASGFLGSLLFGQYIDKIPIRKLLIFSVFAGVVMILFNYLYFFPYLVAHLFVLKTIAFASNIVFGMVNVLIFLTLLNLAAKVSPEHAGGTVFAFLMAAFNLGQLGSNVLGGIFFPILGLKPLIFISALFSLWALLLMPYLSVAEELTAFEKTIKKGLHGLFAFLGFQNRR